MYLSGNDRFTKDNEKRNVKIPWRKNQINLLKKEVEDNA